MTEREIAIDALVKITSDGLYSNLHLKKTLAQHSSLTATQKAFVTELVNGSLRNLIYLDYCIANFSNTPIKKLRPFILNTLRISAYQILFLYRTPNFAVCNEAVKLVKARGFIRLSGFVNAVLRAMARGDIPLPQDRLGALAIKYSYPEWLMNHFIDEIGMEATERMCKFFASAPDVRVAINTLRTNSDELSALLEAEGMTVRRSIFFDDMLHISNTSDLSKSAAFNRGLFHVMDESSVLAARILDAQQGTKLIDACAAPGGKSFYSAYLMRNSGEIRSCDIHAFKLELISKSAQRLGLSSIIAEQCDATVYEPSLDSSADFLLLDAPCSGLGLLRKKPDIKYGKKPEDIPALAELQRKMLENCSRYVKPGGILVYSTCTISKGENQDNIKWFTDNFPFEAQEIRLPSSAGIECATAEQGYVQIIPGELEMDGFFIARFRRLQ